MYSKVNTACLHGLSGILVTVEADVSEGLPNFEMIGELSGSVKEGASRIRTALKNNGFRLPPKRIVVNFAPVDLRKDGNHFDLPSAAAILAAMGSLDGSKLKDVMIAGELGLGGEIRSIEGAIVLAACAEKEKMRYLIVPKANEREAAAGSPVPVIGIRHISQLAEILENPEKWFCGDSADEEQKAEDQYPDFAEIAGQQSAKRAAEIAIAGMHNLLMIGPPGVGKTMIARCIPGIMPELSKKEQLELTRIYSISGLIPEGNGLIRRRPFRAPHHSITVPSLAGGGLVPKPGELSLAHHGILFLDEIPEMRREAIEALRQPMEEKRVRISRLHGVYEYPSAFVLIGAMNPCSCGFYPDRSRCRCTDWEAMRYQNRVSQPIMDRIDLRVQVGRIPYELLQKKGKKGMSSAQIRSHVEHVREVQTERFKEEAFSWNSEIPPNKLDRYCEISSEGELLLKRNFDESGMSARGFHRVLRVARTIADLDDSEVITVSHIQEALYFRNEMGGMEDGR